MLAGHSASDEMCNLYLMLYSHLPYFAWCLDNNNVAEVRGRAALLGALRRWRPQPGMRAGVGWALAPALCRSRTLWPAPCPRALCRSCTGRAGCQPRAAWWLRHGCGSRLQSSRCARVALWPAEGAACSRSRMPPTQPLVTPALACRSGWGPPRSRWARCRAWRHAPTAPCGCSIGARGRGTLTAAWPTLAAPAAGQAWRRKGCCRGPWCCRWAADGGAVFGQKQRGALGRTVKGQGRSTQRLGRAGHAVIPPTPPPPPPAAGPGQRGGAAVVGQRGVCHATHDHPRPRGQPVAHRCVGRQWWGVCPCVCFWWY